MDMENINVTYFMAQYDNNNNNINNEEHSDTVDKDSDQAVRFDLWLTLMDFFMCCIGDCWWFGNHLNWYPPIFPNLFSRITFFPKYFFHELPTARDNRFIEKSSVKVVFVYLRCSRT